jgi:hypothetical protein
MLPLAILVNTVSHNTPSFALQPTLFVLVSTFEAYTSRITRDRHSPLPMSTAATSCGGFSFFRPELDVSRRPALNLLLSCSVKSYRHLLPSWPGLEYVILLNSRLAS